MAVDVSPAAHPAVGEGDAPNPVKGDITRHETQHSKLPQNIPSDSINNLLPTSHKDATTDNSSSSRAFEQTSQPMSKAPSTSSHNDSAKDESSAGPTPYGTRSRNRPNAQRPNYAEDQDMDLDSANMKAESSRRSLSHDSSSKSRAPSESARPPATTLRLTTGPSKLASAPLNGNAYPEKFFAESPIESQGEKKKRKPERPPPPKPAATVASQPIAKETIPGTSQFLAMPHENSEPPPAKKRKTGDDIASGSSTVKAKIPFSSHKSDTRDTCVVTFDNTRAILQRGKLVADDGTVYAPDDCVYLVCEPPGDPYYLARIMEFRTANPNNPRSPVVSILVNWFYRPRDISRYSSDPRFLFASMQSDESPLNSLRGKCDIKHRVEIQDLEEFRRKRDSFYFMQLYDRYSRRPYEMIASSAVINVPPNIKKAIDEQWKFLVVEPARQKELTSAVKLCKRCGLYCAPEKSVDCGVCRETYHMTCVSPPLSRKPSRGFAWSCGPCSRAQERKLEERHTTVIDSEQEKRAIGGDEEDPDAEDQGGSISPPEPVENDSLPEQPPEQAEVAKSNMWPWRYLGVHCRVEDVLQYDDRAIYPRASSRLGNRHQAEVRDWFGRPVKLVEPSHLVKKFKGFGKGRDPKVSKEVQAQWQQEKAQQKTRPGYIQDQPQGYIARGEDYVADDERCTATPLFVKPDESATSSFAAVNAKQPTSDAAIDEYIAQARKLAKEWKLITISKKGDPQISTNFLDQALWLLTKNKFNSNAAIQELHNKHNPAALKNPELNELELKKFEDGVAKHGSDLRSVRKHVKTKSHGDIVRFYYTWKFTQKGSEIWGGNVGRKGVKRRAESSWLDIADDEDDSAFNNEKAQGRKRRFQCKHCASRSSKRWRRAPNVAPGATVLADPKGGKEKANQLVVALCERCAILWRRYAIVWADPEDVARSFVQTGGRQWKKKQEEEWLREIIIANELAGVQTRGASAAAAGSMGIELLLPIDDSIKRRAASGKERDNTPTTAQVQDQTKKKVVPAPAPVPPPPPPREPSPPLEPSPPRKKDLPCVVCRHLETPSQDLKLECSLCRMNVHRHCYGISDTVNNSHWVCDTCVNDKKQQYLLRYECAACPVVDRAIELYEPPKVSHKKKTDREREKERLEKAMVQTETDSYFKSQRKRGRPQFPREALKLTENSNWMHIICAVWTPEIKFSDAAKFQRAEGMAAIVHSSRTEQLCKICKRPEKAVVTCHQCHTPFHAMCAHDAGYTFGFDVTPVKGSRKDAVSSVTLGSETGSLTAAIWCKEHTPKTIVHDMTEVVEATTGMNALQLYTQTYKQADLTLTGTARKANLLSQSAKTLATSAGARKTSSMANSTANGAHNKVTNGDEMVNGGLTNGASEGHSEPKQCNSCETKSAIKWHKIFTDQPMVDDDNDAGDYRWQCHRCYMKAQDTSRPTSTHRTAETIAKPLDETPDLFRPKRTPMMGDKAGMENLQHFADELRQTTIVLTNPKFGGLHVLQGKDLRLELDSDPRPAFRYMIYQASVKCGYDQERDVIITEDGSWVTFPKSMMQALVKMIVAGSREGHWRSVSARDVPCKLMQNVYIPPGPNRPGGTAPFPQHLAPPTFQNVQTPRYPPPGSATLPGSTSLAVAPFSNLPLSLNGTSRPPPPPPSLTNGVTTPTTPVGMPGPFQAPNGVGTPGMPPAPPGYQPAQPQGPPFNSPPAQLNSSGPPSGPNGATATNGHREGSITAASSSPNVHNLLRQ